MNKEHLYLKYFGAGEHNAVIENVTQRFLLAECDPLTTVKSNMNKTHMSLKQTDRKSKVKSLFHVPSLFARGVTRAQLSGISQGTLHKILLTRG